MKLSFHTSQHQSPGYTSLQLGIAYTEGLLNEKQISDAIELALSIFISSISSTVVGTQSKERQLRAHEESSERDSLDEISQQILCESTYLSTV
jgi:hypothetical protein